MMPIRPSSNTPPARPLSPIAEEPVEQAPPSPQAQQAHPATSERRHAWHTGLRPSGWLRNCLVPPQARADRLAEASQASGAPAVGAMQPASSSAVLTAASFSAAMISWCYAEVDQRDQYTPSRSNDRLSRDDFVAQVASVAREMKKLHDGLTDELRIHGLPAMRLPAQLGQLQGMHTLSLTACDVRTLPDTLGDLPQLRQIILRDNDRLEALPHTLSQMAGLVTLQVIQGNITALPPLEGMLGLQTLCLMELPLGRLPDDIGKLPALTSLRASSCDLTHIPPSIGEATALTELLLGKNPLLTSLPEEVGLLRNLVVLDLKDCRGLVRLPTSLNNLDNLSQVNLSNCTSLVELPDALVQLAWQGKVMLPRHMHYMRMHEPYSADWHAAAARQHDNAMRDQIRHLDHTDRDALERFLTANDIPSHIIMQRGLERVASAHGDKAKLNAALKWPGLPAWARKYDEITINAIKKSDKEMEKCEKDLDADKLNSKLYEERMKSIAEEHNILLYGIPEQKDENTGAILVEAVPGRFDAIAQHWLELASNATGSSSSRPGAPSRS